MSNQHRWSVGTVISATGIVYGDIGTSPLYALEQSLSAAGPFDSEAVMGVLSLIFWALAISVTLKYVTIIMRADNDGEGGILALFALAKRHLMGGNPWTKTVIAMALAGTAFFFCDALITPAISVLSAVEGMELLDAGFSRYVIPVTIGVLFVLFFYQRRGTARVASLFGPVMIVWFAVLAVTGALAIGRAPQVLYACNPVYGVSLLLQRPTFALAIIGAVFLSVIAAMAISFQHACRSWIPRRHGASRRPCRPVGDSRTSQSCRDRSRAEGARSRLHTAFDFDQRNRACSAGLARQRGNGLAIACPPRARPDLVCVAAIRKVHARPVSHGGVDPIRTGISIQLDWSAR